MDSESGQQQKQQRRKRKDPESRDFVCKCGKSYLSYAAAYTHVKNKHDGDAQHLNNISKPDREKLKRGRPKEKKVFSITTETQKLSIIQQAILQIFEILNAQKIILEGNQQVRLDQLIKSYEELCKEMGGPGSTLFIDHDKYGPTGKNLNEFIESINKHFTPKVSAKVIWFISFILADQIKPTQEPIQIDIDEVRKKINAEAYVCKKLWDQKEAISTCIVDTLEKWMKTNEKEHQNGDKNQQ